MFEPNYLKDINKKLFPKTIIGCGREHISTAKKGDIVIYTGGVSIETKQIVKSNSFTIGKEYILSRDYASSVSNTSYFVTVDGDIHENGYLSIVVDNTGFANGWNAALFKLKNKE